MRASTRRKSERRRGTEIYRETQTILSSHVHAGYYKVTIRLIFIRVFLILNNAQSEKCNTAQIQTWGGGKLIN